MSLKEITGQRLNIEHLDAYPIYIEMPARAFSMPFNDDLPHFQYTCAFSKDGQLDWMTVKEDIERIGKRLIEIETERPGYFTGAHQDWNAKFESLMSSFQGECHQDLSRFSDTELAEAADTFLDKYLHDLRFPLFLDAYMFYADKKLLGLLSEFREAHQTSENPNVMFSILSAPVDESFLKQEENALIELANRKLKGEDISGAVKDHQQKYLYIHSGYGGLEEYTVEMIEQKIRELIDGKRLTVHDVASANKKAKEELMNKYQFTDEIKRLATMTEIFTIWQDERKELVLSYIALVSKYVREIARRTGIAYEDLIYAAQEELKMALEGKLDVAVLQERREQPYLRLYKEGKIAYSVCGDEAQAFRDQAYQMMDEGLTEVRGFAASIGKVFGTVKVIMSLEDAKKIETGDVMVIPMTRPEHTPYMKLASAIVTDDGGITCHAAIVSRELGIPCIIGTKIATKVLKDGDEVEVDANHGVVTKITN